MKRAGLFHLSFGLEAGSDRVRNDIVGKKIDIADFENLVRWCREFDVIPNVFFIFSHPTETWEDAGETIRIIEKYKDEIEGSVAILHIYPGTPLEKLALDTGVLPPGFTWTRPFRKHVVTLPLAQGDVPLYIDKLTWSQISRARPALVVQRGADLGRPKRLPRPRAHPVLGRREALCRHGRGLRAAEAGEAAAAQGAGRPRTQELRTGKPRPRS